MKNIKYLTSFDLKIIAIVLMTIDHIGAILYPKIMLFRLIGRLSFPIFLFLLVEGFTHTKNKFKYFLRLLFFAFISEIIYDYTFYQRLFYFKDQNVLFLLSLGFLMLCSIQKIDIFINNNNIDKVYSFINHFFNVILFSLLSIIFHFNYSIYGILFLYFLYLCKDHLFLFTLLFFPLSFFLIRLLSFPSYQICSLLSIIIFLFYNKEKGPSKKFLFYIYYPLHLILLCILAKFFL